MNQDDLREEGNLVVKFMQDTTLQMFESEIEILEKVSDLKGFCKLVDKG